MTDPLLDHLAQAVAWRAMPALRPVHGTPAGVWFWCSPEVREGYRRQAQVLRAVLDGIVGEKL